MISRYGDSRLVELVPWQHIPYLYKERTGYSFTYEYSGNGYPLYVLYDNEYGMLIRAGR